MRLRNFILINSILLIGLGILGYFIPEPPLPTSILLSIFGLVFLITLPLLSQNLKIAVFLFPLLHLFLLFAILGFIRRAVEVQDWGNLGLNAALFLTTGFIFYLLVKKWRMERAALTPPDNV